MLVWVARVRLVAEVRVDVPVVATADRHEVKLFRVLVRGRVVLVLVPMFVRMRMGVLVRMGVDEVAVPVLVRVGMHVLVRMLVRVRVTVLRRVIVSVTHDSPPVRPSRPGRLHDADHSTLGVSRATRAA